MTLLSHVMQCSSTIIKVTKIPNKTGDPLKAHVHPKDIARLCCFEIVPAFTLVIFGFSVRSEFNAARHVFWVNMGL